MLLVDVSYLAWRAYYSTGHLQNVGDPVGVIYGVLRDIPSLLDRFATDQIVFCFDSGVPKRKKVYPAYKESHINAPDKVTARDTVREQVAELKHKILPELGFVNLIWAKGYEGDDMIATVAINHPGQKVIVSGDGDLYQLLTEEVSMYNPRAQASMTVGHFEVQYGIDAKDWPMVKAIAGCSTDNIKGVKGVGEKTAIKYLKDQLKMSSELYQRIEQNLEVWQSNIDLVKLPFSGCPIFKLKKQPPIDQRKWREMMGRMNMPSLGNRYNG
jgi:DNA polymerase-1